MKRALVVLSFVSFQLSAISVRELIDPALGGHQPPIVDGVLDLSNKEIASLEGLELLENPLTVNRLILRYNKLATLPAGIFDALVNLRGLHLSNNQLTTLPVGIFDALVNLEDGLYLHNNQLTTLPAGIFNTLVNLRELYLYNNQLTTLPAVIFNALVNLRGLDLRDNQLTTLPAGIFDALAHLQWIYLNNNQLTTLPVGIFDALVNLQSLYLYLNNNQFQETTPQFKEKYLVKAPNIVFNFKTPKQETAEAIQREIFKTVQKFAQQGAPSLKHIYVQVLNHIRQLAQSLRNHPGKNAMVTMRDEKGNTLMHLAVKTGDYELINIVAQALPRFVSLQNKKKETPLHTAIFFLGPDDNTQKIIKLLLSMNPRLIDIKDGASKTPIEYAAGLGQDMLQFLLDIVYSKPLPQEPQPSTSYKKERKS